MSMTREEASDILSDEEISCLIGKFHGAKEALDLALSALRPVSREQVEKVWRGEWISYLDGEHIMPERYYSCSKCGDRGYTSKRNFCDSCGAPMTGEAVEMVMERLEALYGKAD